jgi:hypothetical protein
MKQRNNDPSASASYRMAEGDAAAVDVRPVRPQPQLSHAGYGLRGERLVQLYEAQVIRRNARDPQRLLDCGYGPQPHVCRVDRPGREAQDADERPEAVPRGGARLGTVWG